MKLQNFLLLTVSILTTFCSCYSENQRKQAGSAKYDKIEVDSSLSQLLNFRIMDMQQAAGVARDNLEERKVSNSIIFLKINDRLDRIGGSTELKCSAEKVYDTLQLDFGQSTSFSGTGFVIKVVKGQFTSIPYSFTDLIWEEEPKTTVLHIEKQKLTLHKSDYKVGDSIFGFLYFRTIDQSGTKYYAQGYFRTKLKQ